MSVLACAFLLALVSLEVLADDEPSPSSIIIDHSFDGGKSFAEKGTITPWSSGGHSFLMNEPLLTTENQRSLMDLALTNSNYVVRAYRRPDSVVLVASCQARYVIASEGKLALILSIDLTGSPIALSIIAKNQTADASIHFSPPSVLTTTVSFQRPSLPIGPETQEYLAKIDRLREEKQRQEQRDNRSFLSKYWMYILPAVIIFVLLNSAEQNAGNSE